MNVAIIIISARIRERIGELMSDCRSGITGIEPAIFQARAGIRAAMRREGNDRVKAVHPLPLDRLPGGDGRDRVAAGFVLKDICAAEAYVHDGIARRVRWGIADRIETDSRSRAAGGLERRRSRHRRNRAACAAASEEAGLVVVLRPPESRDEEQNEKQEFIHCIFHKILSYDNSLTMNLN